MSGKTVLYVEDDDDDAFFMQIAFKQVGLPYQLTRVADGGQVIDYLSGQGEYSDRQKHPLPSLLLLDLKLPVKTGFEILQWLRAHPGLNDLKVVVMSSSGLEEDINMARQMGVIDYVVKPSVPSRLAEIVRKGWDRWSK